MRVLVVGHGLVGERRARAIHELAATHHVSLAGTVDPASRPPQRYAGAPHFSSLGEVPTNAYDAAVVAVPHDVAPQLANTVLTAGKPVLLEKPLGRTLPEAACLAAAAQRPELPSFVGYNYRFMPHLSRALHDASQGKLGRLRSVDAFLGHGGHPGSARGWKLDPERAGGGVILDPGVHLLDLILWLFPDLRPSHVRATSGFWGTGVEEDATAVLTADRALVTLRISHLCWVNTLRLNLMGEEGYALAKGRGGNYGPAELRIGRRWGWNDGSGRSQRETEQREVFPDDDGFLAETAAVAAR
jgi:predicted dehydrogenase